MSAIRVSGDLLRQSLRLARLPLTAIEHVARRRGVEVSEWYPSRAFERVEGDVERVVGSLLGDGALVEEGHRHLARVQQLQHARRLDAYAEERRAVAHARFDERHRAAVAQRHELDAAAEAFDEEVVAEAEERKADAQEAARRQSDAVEREAREARAAVSAARRNAEAVRVAEEAAVLEHEEQAEEADERARQAGGAASAAKRTRATRGNA